MLEKKYQINLAFLLLQFEMLRAALGEWGARGQGAASAAHGLGGEKSSSWARMPSRASHSVHENQ